MRLGEIVEQLPSLQGACQGRVLEQQSTTESSDAGASRSCDAPEDFLLCSGSRLSPHHLAL